MVGLGGNWDDDGNLTGVVTGPVMEDGIGQPSLLQLFVAVAVLKAELAADEVVVDGKAIRMYWSDENTIDVPVVEIGNAVVPAERVALAEVIRVMASVQVETRLMADIMHRQRQHVAVPGVVVPPGGRFH